MMRHGITTISNAQAAHGLIKCACPCGRTFARTVNRNGREKKFYNDKCRADWDRIVRQYGHIFAALDMKHEKKLAFIESLRKIGTGRISVIDKNMVETRRKRQETINLDAMRPQERLGALCRAAEQWGVMR